MPYIHNQNQHFFMLWPWPLLLKINSGQYLYKAVFQICILSYLIHIIKTKEIQMETCKNSPDNLDKTRAYAKQPT